MSKELNKALLSMFLEAAKTYHPTKGVTEAAVNAVIQDVGRRANSPHGPNAGIVPHYNLRKAAYDAAKEAGQRELTAALEGGRPREVAQRMADSVALKAAVYAADDLLEEVIEAVLSETLSGLAENRKALAEWMEKWGEPNRGTGKSYVEIISLQEELLEEHLNG